MHGKSISNDKMHAAMMTKL